MRVEPDGDLGVRSKSILHDPARSELAPSMHHRNAGGEASEEGRFFHRGIPAPYADDLLATEEEPVVGGTGRNAVPTKPLFVRELQPPRVRAVATTWVSPISRREDRPRVETAGALGRPR